MKVWVVMGNDFPGAVFSTEEEADEFVRTMKTKDRDNNLGQPFPHRVNWRSYDFELDAGNSVTTICGTNIVKFPETRKNQSSDLMSLAGDALTRGDRSAWQALYNASKALEGIPEYNSDEGRHISATIAAYFSGRVSP